MHPGFLKAKSGGLKHVFKLHVKLNEKPFLACIVFLYRFLLPLSTLDFNRLCD